MPKPTLPTLREKNRYMVFEVLSDGKFDKAAITRAVWNNAAKLLGEAGLSKTGLWVMEWDDEKQKGLLRTNRGGVDEIRASLALVKEVDGAPVIIHVLGISGTIKQAREKWL